MKVSSSWENLTDKATVIFPRAVSFDGRNIAEGDNPLFARGDKIELFAGYVPYMNKIFQGFIVSIKNKAPIELECEDEMWALKQITLTKSYENISLNGLLTDILKGTIFEGKFNKGVSFDAINLGQFRITKASIAQIFEELKNTYGLKTFVRDGILYCGLAYYPELRKDVEFEFEKTIINDRDLEYRNGDDVKIKIQGISILPDNSKITYEVGDKDGEQRTLHYYNLTDSELKSILDNIVKNGDLKYTGYYGTIPAFGEPIVRHGDGAVIISNKFPERKGTYLIKSVDTEFSVNAGYKQNIEIQTKIA